MTKQFDFVKFLKKSLIISGSVILAGIILTCVLGVKFDISFVGGSRIVYSYTGDVNTNSVRDAIRTGIGADAQISETSDFSDNSQKIIITFSGDVTEQVDPDKVGELVAQTSSEADASSDASSEETSSNVSSEETSSDVSSDADSSDTSSVSSETEESNEPVSADSMVSIQNAITKVLNDSFPDNGFVLSEANTVNPTLAGAFFVKSLVAVVIAAALVILYIGIRFRKIGGVSAGIASFIALIEDVVIAFFVCVIFRLDVDTNFFAVILTLFGYSLNNTIVIFDRVRENKKYFPTLTVREHVNRSIRETLARSIMTTVTTFAAIMAVVVVAEIFGVTALRSFAIPMAVGVLAGCYSSVFLAGPLWVKWCEFSEAREPKKGKK